MRKLTHHRANTHAHTPQHMATHCHVLQHPATHRNTLHHTVPHCSMRERALYRANRAHVHAYTQKRQRARTRYGILSTHCNTLQHVATTYCIMCQCALSKKRRPTQTARATAKYPGSGAHPWINNDKQRCASPDFEIDLHLD